MESRLRRHRCRAGPPTRAGTPPPGLVTWRYHADEAYLFSGYVECFRSITFRGVWENRVHDAV